MIIASLRQSYEGTQLVDLSLLKLAQNIHTCFMICQSPFVCNSPISVWLNQFVPISINVQCSQRQLSTVSCQLSWYQLFNISGTKWTQCSSLWCGKNAGCRLCTNIVGPVQASVSVLTWTHKLENLTYLQPHRIVCYHKMQKASSERLTGWLSVW